MTTNAQSSLPVLLVDDEPQLLNSTGLLLRSSGFEQILSLSDSREVLPLMEEKDIGVVVLDLRMPHITGQELLEKIQMNHPELPVIIMTAIDQLETAVQCMKAGAFDFLVKPIETNRLLSAIQRAMEMRVLRGELSSLKNQLLDGQIQDPEIFGNIITRNRKMHSLFQYIEAIGPSDQPALIMGETGTGKELIAEAVHRSSARSGNFIPVNVAGLDDTVFSDTLFGHLKGAFTGADRQREGLIAQAADGTLFLDEIGDLSEASQVKLLRLLQDRKYYPLGSDHARQSRARIVVATSKNLIESVAEGSFRKDLYYRLRAHQIQVPPLRSRRDDLPLLINFFLKKASDSLNRKKPGIPEQLYLMLVNYQFPGNIRELETMIFDAVARNNTPVLSLSSFREIIGEEQKLNHDSSLRESGLACLGQMFPDHLPTLKEAEQFLMTEALNRAENNQGIAAGMLGISRQALNKRLVREKNGPG